MKPGPTILKELVVQNKYGIHARPAALLVKIAAKFTCEIFISHQGSEVSAKSIMGLLTIEGHHGARIRIKAVGGDAEAAVQEIAELFENKFFEE